MQSKSTTASPNAEFDADVERLVLAIHAIGAMQIARESTRGRQSETHRMITEKIAALTEAQDAAATVAIRGGSDRALKKALGVYKKRVRRNNQRLRRKLRSRT